MSYNFATSNAGSAMMGKFTVVCCVSLMSPIQFMWLSIGSTLSATTFTFRLSNSPRKLATAPSSVVQTGVMGAAATLDAKIQQAQDGAGTGVKDVPTKSIVQIVKASGDNKQALINFKPEDVDNANNFAFVRLSLTVGVAASLVAAQMVGVNPRYAASDSYNQAGVVQIIG